MKSISHCKQYNVILQGIFLYEHFAHSRLTSQLLHLSSNYSHSVLITVTGNMHILIPLHSSYPSQKYFTSQAFKMRYTLLFCRNTLSGTHISRFSAPSTFSAESFSSYSARESCSHGQSQSKKKTARSNRNHRAQLSRRVDIKIVSFPALQVQTGSSTNDLIAVVPTEK